MIEREAERQGVSAAQLIREATIIRVAMLSGLRGDGEARTTLADIARRAGGQGGEPKLADPALIADPKRLAALAATDLLDSDPSESFDRITRLASALLEAPVALVSLVDEDRQYFKSCLGLPPKWADERQTPLSHSFCQHAVAMREPLIVPDAREDPLLRDNLAIPDLGVIAYAGIPLITSDDQALGSLCVIDDKPRAWTAEQIKMLGDLAQTVVELIERRSNRDATHSD